VAVPLCPTPDDRRHRALLILLLLARDAGLAPEDVVGPAARGTALRGIADGPPRRGAPSGAGRPWMCRRRWTARPG
jgi:hypothetical protein